MYLAKRLGLVVALCLAASAGSAAFGEEKDLNKVPADYKGPKKGTFTGEVRQSDEAHRLIVAGKNDDVRHFFPRWIGGMPDQGGGFDKAMMKLLAKLNPGDTVEVKWTLDERFRVGGLKVLKRAPAKPAAEKEKDGKKEAGGKKEEDPNKPANYKGPKEGVFTGMVRESEEAHRLIVAGKKDDVRHFFPRWIGGMPDQGGGFDKAMLEQIGKLRPGNEVEVKWEFDERFRAVKIKVVKQAEKSQ